MLPSLSAAAPGFAAALCAATCLATAAYRIPARRRHLERLDNLEKSSELLDLHASNLALFLDHAGSPAELKRLLLLFADLIADRNSASELAAWLAERPLDGGELSREAADLARTVSELGRTQPELATAFSSSILCGLLGAMLRWPDTARLFARTGPAMAADNNRSVTVALRALAMRGLSFVDLGTRQPALA